MILHYFEIILPLFLTKKNKDILCIENILYILSYVLSYVYLLIVLNFSPKSIILIPFTYRI